MPTANIHRVILGRHGQTVFNRDGFIMGRSDSPLTGDGVASAQALARILENERIGTIFSSPLGRAFSTAGIYGKALGLPVQKKDGMAELSCGIWEGEPRYTVTANPHALRETWHEKPQGGESYHDAEERVSRVIQEIREQSEEKTVLVVGHAGVNRVFLKLWLDLEPERVMRIVCPHETVYCLEPNRDVYAKSASGVVRQETWPFA